MGGGAGQRFRNAAPGVGRELIKDHGEAKVTELVFIGAILFCPRA